MEQHADKSKVTEISAGENDEGSQSLEYIHRCRVTGSCSQAFGSICKGRWKFLETPRGTFPSFSSGLYFENKLGEDVLYHRETKRLRQ